MIYPVLYSFRRCPYAMRARMALAYSDIKVEIREIVLRDKPADMLALSPKGTVPVLQLTDGTVLEESLDIMRWSVAKVDPQQWLSVRPDKQFELIADNDGYFKSALDRYKYPDRYDNVDPIEQRQLAEKFLLRLDECLQQHAYLMSDNMQFADAAIFPFIRQFARTDEDWFFSKSLSALQGWYQRLLQSELFNAVMKKYAVWKPGADEVYFP